MAKKSSVVYILLGLAIKRFYWKMREITLIGCKKKMILCSSVKFWKPYQISSNLNSWFLWILQFVTIMLYFKKIIFNVNFFYILFMLQALLVKNKVYFLIYQDFRTFKKNWLYVILILWFIISHIFFIFIMLYYY